MGWNEPPDDNRGKDPWGNRGDEGPPDLDEIVKKMQSGFGGLFKGNSNGSNQANNTAPLIFIALALIVYLAWDMTYAIDQGEQGVVMRFGRYQQTLLPGLNIRLPRPIEYVEKVKVGKVRTFPSRASMLTQDENIVDVEVAVKWQISDPVSYIFNVSDPENTLRQSTESAVRDVIGKSKLDFILTEGRNEIAVKQKTLLQNMLDEYQVGIFIENVELQSTKPPEAVKDAFDDVIKAREDKQRKVNEAEAYRNEIIPVARGEAARVREESNAYKSRVIARAEGEANRFDQQLREYRRAPDITRQRLYLDAMENILSNSSKILIDTDNSNSLMYLPIDQLMKQGSGSTSFSFPGSQSGSQSQGLLPEARDRYSDRLRGVR